MEKTKLKVYVELLDEGSTCFRPTTATRSGEGIYILDPTQKYDPEDEHWEVTPGSRIVLQNVNTQDGDVISVARLWTEHGDVEKRPKTWIRLSLEFLVKYIR